MSIWDVLGANALAGKAIVDYLDSFLSTTEEVAEIAPIAETAVTGIINDTAVVVSEMLDAVPASIINETISNTVTLALSNATAVVPEIVSSFPMLAFSNVSDIVPNITNTTSTAVSIITNAVPNFTFYEALESIVDQVDMDTAFELATEHAPWIAVALAITATFAITTAALWNCTRGNRPVQKPVDAETINQRLQSAQVALASSSYVLNGSASSDSDDTPSAIIFLPSTNFERMFNEYVLKSREVGDRGTVDIDGLILPACDYKRLQSEGPALRASFAQALSLERQQSGNYETIVPVAEVDNIKRRLGLSS